MLIATLQPASAAEGARITWAAGRFELEGHGRLSPEDVMRYDEEGHLVWVNEGARAWVGSKATRRGRTTGDLVAGAKSWLTAGVQRIRVWAAAPGRTALLKRISYVAIAALAALNAVLLLVAVGVVHLP